MTVQSLEDLLTSLLDCACLSDVASVRGEAAAAACSLGRRRPEILLTAAHAYLMQRPKLSPSNRALVMRVLCSVSEEVARQKHPDEQLILLVINLATQEMTMTKDSDTEWADAARDVLVTLAKDTRLAHFVMDAVLQKFTPGHSAGPHRYVIDTLRAVASANPRGFVPFLTDVLCRCVPVLTHVRLDPLRSQWARALCAFFEAVRECEAAAQVQEATEDQSELPLDDELVSRATYSEQSEAVFDTVFQWIYAKDARTRAEVALCIGELCVMMRPSKVTEELKKIVTQLISLYKKAQPDHAYLITQGVCRFLEATCEEESCPLDAYIDDVLNALFPNACLDADDAAATPDPNAIRNHAEAFRSFHVAASRFGDRIVYYLLHKMQHVNDLNKLAAINLMRHLLNSAGPHMEDKRSLVMMGLKKLLAAEQQASTRVKRAMVQLCVALSDHAYVDADGGDHVIAFLVRNLVANHDAETQRRTDYDVAGSNQLRTQCAQALQTISSTCVCAYKLLWPYLLEFVCVERYSGVAADLFKCLRVLLRREKEAGRKIDYIQGFDNPLVAGRHQIFARLFVCMSGAPKNGLLARRARESLCLLLEMCAWFHPSVEKVVNEEKCDEMQGLIDELSGCGSSGCAPLELRWKRVARWHDAVIQLLQTCVASIPEGDWRTELAAAMGKQLDLYSQHADDKAFLMRCLGTVLSKITSKGTITDYLMLMFKSTVHSSPVERAGLARAVGAIAAVHTDLVITELENVSKWEHAKKSTGWFGMIKDAAWSKYTDVEMVHLRASLMLAFGHAAAACPSDQLPQRLDGQLIVFLRHYMANGKQESVVRECLVETMRLIAVSVHPSRVGEGYVFEARNELLAYIKDYVQSESTELLSSSLRLLAAKATAALVRLQPAISDSDIWDLGHILTKYTLPICREKNGLKTLASEVMEMSASLFAAGGRSLSLDSAPAGHAHYAAGATSTALRIDDDEASTMMDATIAQYNGALEALIRMRPVVQTVTLILKMLQPYYGRVADHERSRAVDATVLVLAVYLDTAHDIQLGHAADFAPLSSLLARLTPRLADSLQCVRVQALRALHTSLRLAHVHKGHERSSDPGVLCVDVFAREHLGDEGKLDGMTAKRAITKMSEVIESRLPQSQMQTYLTGLFDMLGDRQSHVSAAAAQLLAAALTARGASLPAEAETVVKSIVARLPEVHCCVQTYSDLLAALVAFAAHQPYVVGEGLLRQPLPHSIHLSDAWACVSVDRTLYPILLDYVIELLSTGLETPFEVLDTGGGSSCKVVKVELCQTAAALTQLIKCGEPECVLLERLPQVLALHVQLLAAVSDTQFPVMHSENADGSRVLIITPELRRSMEKPAGLAVAGIKTLLTRTRIERVTEEMNTRRAWTDCLDKVAFIEALTHLLRSLYSHRPHWIQPCVQQLAKGVDSVHEPMRLAVAVAAAGLVESSDSSSPDEQLVDECVRLLQAMLTDSSLRIRKLCVRGLGDVALCGSAAACERHTAVAIDAAMAGLDDLGDRGDELAMASLRALLQLSARASSDQLRDILPAALLKCRPCFDKQHAPLRAAAFSLFGELGSRVGEGAEMEGQVHSNWVAMLLHANDEDATVAKESARALRRLCPLLPAALAGECAQREIGEDGRVKAYPNLQEQMCLVMVSSFPDKVNQYALTCSNYFKASSGKLRANAASMTGYMLSQLSPQLRATISKELVLSGLAALLRDSDDVSVVIAATKAIALLHDFQ